MKKKFFMVFVITIMAAASQFTGSPSAEEKKLGGTHDVGADAKPVAAPEEMKPVPGGTMRIIVGHGTQCPGLSPENRRQGVVLCPSMH